MLFLHPWLLLGAVGAAVPVLLHFFGRRRARRVQFSSLMLIQQAQRERSALLRVRQLLLLILRVLTILALSLAAAQPLLPLPGPSGHTVVVLDTTPSMRAMDGLGLYRDAGGVPRAALQAAAQRVAGNRRVAAALLTEMPYPYNTALDVSDRGRYRAMDNAPLLAGQGGADDRESLTLVFFTDLQASSWLTPATLAPGRRVVVVDCGRDDVPNRSLLRVEPRDPAVIAGRPTELVITGRSWERRASEAASPPAGTAVPVRLKVDGREIGTVTLNMGAEPSQAVCEWRPEGAGLKRIEAVLPDDAMPEDNACYAVVPVRQRLRVLILGTGPAERLMALALAPDANAPVNVRTVAALPEAPDADAIIVSQAPTAAEVTRLQQAAQAGVGLVVMVPRVPLAALAALTGDQQLSLKAARPGPLHIGEFDVFRPPLRAFANPQAGDLKQPEFRQVPDLQVPPTQWRVAARFEDGSIAMALGPAGPGKLLLVNLPLDAQRTNLPQCPAFVPLLHRLVGFVARQSGPDFGDVLVGQRVRMPLPGAKMVQVYGPNGKALWGSPGGEVFASDTPGFHRLVWSRQGQEHETTFAVNMDPAEGDLRRTTPAHVREMLRGDVTVVRPDAAGTVKLPPATGGGLGLAAPLLVLVLLLLLVELALAHGLRLPVLRRRGEA